MYTTTHRSPVTTVLTRRATGVVCGQGCWSVCVLECGVMERGSCWCAGLSACAVEAAKSVFGDVSCVCLTMGKEISEGEL